MSIVLSTMKCPVCEEQTLETLSAALGSFERCPNCSGIFISHDLIVAASQDHAKCAETLKETEALLLPTARGCPKCLQKLFEGRVRSRGVILILCPPDQYFWTDFPTLRQFDEVVEKNLRFQMDLALNSGSAESRSASGGLTGSPAVRLYEDSGLGKFFRSFARVFDRWADSFGSEPGEKPQKKPAPVKPEPKKKEKKPLILEVETAAPAPVAAKVEPVVEPAPPPAEPPKKEPEPEAPRIEIPEFIFPEEPKVEEKASAKPEPAPTPVPPPPEPLPKPEVKKPLPQPALRSPQAAEKGPGFFAKLKAAWSPSPKRSAPSEKPVKPPATQQGGRAPEVWRSVKPVEPVKPVQPVKPAVLLKAAKPIDLPQPKSDGGFGKKLAAFFAPKPKPKPVPKPTQPVPAPKPAPVVKKPAPAPKPKKEKVPKDPFDHVAFWPPWALAVVGVVSSAFRDFGFEAGPAVLWGIAGWSIGTMVRLMRLYRSPMTLQGQIVLADEQKPNGEVVLKVEDKTILLNRLARWDLIPRLFGLSNPRQLLKGDVTVKGWYRGKLIPSFEVYEVRSEKAVRKSMVKSLRWASAMALCVIAMVIYLSLE